MNWPDWLKVFDLKPRFAFSVWLFSLILIVLPQSTLKYLGIDQIVEGFKPWISLLGIAFLILWFVQLAPWNLVINFYNEQSLKKNFAKSLETLSEIERMIVAYCIERKAQTIHLNAGHPIASSLRAKGFLRILPGMSSLEAVPYYFPHQIFSLLTDNRDLILPAETWKDPALKETFDQLEEQLRENARRGFL